MHTAVLRQVNAIRLRKDGVDSVFVELSYGYWLGMDVAIPPTQLQAKRTRMNEHSITPY